MIGSELGGFLGQLKQRFTGSDSVPEKPEISAEPSRDLRIVIGEHRLSGNFLSPDLLIKGRFSGDGLVKADLIIMDEEGKVYYREENAFPEIGRLKGQAGRSEVSFEKRISSSKMARGVNTIKIILHGAGGTVETVFEERKRFKF